MRIGGATLSLAKSVYRAHPTDDEIAEVLGQRGIASMGTLNPDGSIHLAYVIFLYADGKFLVETSSVTRKARNVEERGQATIMVDGRTTGGRNVMVSAEGTARILHDTEARAANARVLAKYLRPDALEGIDRAFSRFDDVTVEITPGRWRSWTNVRLRQEAEAEIGAGRYGEVWLD